MNSNILKGEGEIIKSRVIFGILFTLLFVVMLTFASDIKPVKSDWTWTETIYIRTDGSVEPEGASISSADNITYTLTDNIVGDVPEGIDAIVVERDNIVVDGAHYIVQGTGNGTGIDLSSRSNVTIKNMEIKAFHCGTLLNSSANCNFFGNNITNNVYDGIELWGYSSNNSISGNTIAANNQHGIYLYESSNNTISGNNITNNHWDGIVLMASSNNVILKNNIEGNEGGIDGWASSYNRIGQNLIAENGNYGIILYNYSSTYNTIDTNGIAYNEIGLWLVGDNNIVYHNNFIDNTNQCLDWGAANTWDNGYPSGGNYWSDYEDRYPDAEEIDDSGIWNTPYVIDENNRDRYPLMEPWPPTSVGGIYIPVNKIELLAPYIGLTLLLVVAVSALVYVRKRKRACIP